MPSSPTAPVPKRKRGGQKTAETLERERRQAELEKIFTGARSFDDQELAETRAIIASLEAAERDWLRSYNSPPFPAHLVHKLEEINPDPELQGPPPDTDEFRTYAAEVRKQATLARTQIRDGQMAGAKAAAEPKLARIYAFAKRNAVLIRQQGKNGYSGRQIAQRVLDEWSQLRRSRLPGEPSSLSRRGDENPPPPLETLRQSWLPKAKAFLARQVLDNA